VCHSGKLLLPHRREQDVVMKFESSVRNCGSAFVTQQGFALNQRLSRLIRVALMMFRQIMVFSKTPRKRPAFFGVAPQMNVRDQWYLNRRRLILCAFDQFIYLKYMAMWNTASLVLVPNHLAQ